jgi:RNA polymerase sigma-70 factor (ECF subfamily)
VTTSISEDFAARTGPYRRELLAYCYQMLGSVHDADDLLQETLLRAWRAYDRYDPTRAALRTWLYRIAANACVTALEQRSRRPLPSGLGVAGDDADQPLIRGEEVPWLQPVPDRALGDPADALLARASLRLAVVAAMQHLPARQRAALILLDVLDLPAAEVAAALSMTPTAVYSAVRRARARLAEADLGQDQISQNADTGDRALVEQYAVAFENADLVALEKLLAQDVLLEMPPFATWFVGRDRYLRFMARIFTLRGTHWRMMPTGANGQPALAAYTRTPDGGYELNTLQVFSTTASGISRNSAFQDRGLFAYFGLPERIAAEDA